MIEGVGVVSFCVWNMIKMPRLWCSQDMSQFRSIDLQRLREAIPHIQSLKSSNSFAHYVIKENKLYKRFYGPYPAFSYFADLVLLHLAANVKLPGKCVNSSATLRTFKRCFFSLWCLCLMTSFHPDVEFLLNVGDWPLIPKTILEDSQKGAEGRISTADSLKGIPMFSWCGSKDTTDIVLPQWDVTRSSMLGSESSNPDLLSAQVGFRRVWDLERALYIYFLLIDQVSLHPFRTQQFDAHHAELGDRTMEFTETEGPVSRKRQ